MHKIKNHLIWTYIHVEMTEQSKGRKIGHEEVNPIDLKLIQF